MTTIALRKDVEKAMIKAEIEFDTWPDFVNRAVREKIEEKGEEKRGGEIEND